MQCPVFRHESFADFLCAFLDALAAVESGSDDSAVNESSGATGRYQITQPYLSDANAFLGTAYTLDKMHDESIATSIVIAYLIHYGDAYERRTGLPATDEVLARIHNGGPRGAEKDSTLEYAERFRAAKEGDE